MQQKALETKNNIIIDLSLPCGNVITQYSFLPYIIGTRLLLQLLAFQYDIAGTITSVSPYQSSQGWTGSHRWGVVLR